MSLLDERVTYKPFHYPWAYEAYELQNKMHWLPSEIPMANDVSDWNSKLSDSEKSLLTQLFRFFTQGDIDVASGYIDKYMPIFKHPELRMMLSSFASMEAIHIDSYSLLIETLGLPEVEYSAFQQYEEMRNKHEYIDQFDPAFHKEDIKAYKYEIAKTLAVYSGFIEGLQLFSSFAILLNFARFNKMKGMTQIVTFSIRDESLHVESMIKLFHAFVDENPEIWNNHLKAHIYQIARDIVELEDQFIDLAFAQSDIEGLTSDEVKQYIRYIADRRLLQLGLKPKFGVKENPLPWLDWIINGAEHTNFFENRATEYSKASLEGNWEDVWASFNGNLMV